jgi:hypothetical protein
VEDIITSPPKHRRYTRQKTELVKRLSPSKVERIHQLLTLEIGDSKPSQFLAHLRNLAPKGPDDFLRSIWSSRLPSNVWVILAGQPEGDLNAAAHRADRIVEAAPQPTIASVAALPEGNTFLHRIEDLSRQVAALSAELAQLPSNSRDPRSRTRSRRSGSRPPSLDDATSTLCWYNRRYGARAQKCTQPCSYRQQERLTQRTSAAAHVCATTTSRLFITDRSVNASSWSTGVQTSLYTPAGSFRDAKISTTATSLRLTVLPYPLTDGCPLASN